MSTQSMRHFTLNLNYAESSNFILLDEWLTSVLEIEIVQDDNVTTHIESLMKRNLLLINFLLQSLSVPCFDNGNILKITQDPKTSSKWIIQIEIVHIDHISNTDYQSIISFAIKSSIWMMQTSITAANIKHLYESIEKQVRSKLKGIKGSGKSTLPVLRAAHQKNIPFFHLGQGIYQLGWGIKSKLLNRSTINLDSNMGALLSENKMLASNLMRIAGLPTPVHGASNNVKDAMIIASKLGWPIVVKPVDGNRGEGVTISVTNDKQLEVAFDVARKFSKSKQILIEREVQGIAHRIVVANKKFIYAVKRRPISVEGDGHSQVHELIKKANQDLSEKPPWVRAKFFPNDDESIKAMNSAGYSLISIPKIKELVPLRMIESTASGGTPEDFTDSIHPDNIEVSLRVAELFGLSVAGIDIITADITKPWYENGAIINEINFAPTLGGERTKKYIPDFLNAIIGQDSRIQINVVVGGSNAMHIAVKQQKRLIKKGKACFLSSHNVTFNDYGNKITFPFQSLYKNCKALLVNNKVEAIVLVIQTDEFLYTGLPIDRINQLTLVDKNIVSSKSLNEKSQEKSIDTLLKLLHQYEKK